MIHPNTSQYRNEKVMENNSLNDVYVFEHMDDSRVPVRLSGVLTPEEANEKIIKHMGVRKYHIVKIIRNNAAQ